MAFPVAYIAVVNVSPRVEDKIKGRGITVDEVKEAVILTEVERSAWHHHPTRGLRFL